MQPRLERHRGQKPPPQSMSVSEPLWMASLQAAGAQDPWSVQLFDGQSLSWQQLSLEMQVWRHAFSRTGHWQ